MPELQRRTRHGQLEVTPIAGIDPMGNVLPEDQGTELQAEDNMRQEIERVRRTGTADNSSGPASGTGWCR